MPDRIGGTVDIYDAIYGRRSIREFEDRAVDRDGPGPHHRGRQRGALVDERAAMALPRGDRAGRRELVGQEMALSTVHLQEYIESLPPEHMETAERFFATLGGAPVAIALSVPVTPDDLMRINHYLAAGCALQNLQLAAYAEGLGCCNLTFAFWVRDKLADTLGVPADREIISLVIVGHPAETPESAAARRHRHVPRVAHERPLRRRLLRRRQHAALSVSVGQPRRRGDPPRRRARARPRGHRRPDAARRRVLRGPVPRGRHLLDQRRGGVGRVGRDVLAALPPARHPRGRRGDPRPRRVRGVRRGRALAGLRRRRAGVRATAEPRASRSASSRTGTRDWRASSTVSASRRSWTPSCRPRS